MKKPTVLRDAVLACGNSVGLGCWQLGGAWGRLDPDEAIAIVETAAEEGVRIFDTALEYGFGTSERVLRAALDTRDQRYAIVTKVPPKNDHWTPGPSSDWRDYFPAEWVASCLQQSIENLGTDHVAVALLHTWCGSWPSDALNSLIDAKAAGLVTALGVSVPDFGSAAGLNVTQLIDAVELTFSVTEQSPRRILQHYQREGVEVIARCPFDSGALAARWTEEKKFGTDDWRSRWVDEAWRKRQIEMSCRFSDLCEHYEVEPGFVALRFVLSHPEVTCVVAGARTVVQARNNSRTGRDPAVPLSLEFIRSLQRMADEKVFGPVFNGAG